jgi:membrane-bound serine protease (ClpP class)
VKILRISIVVGALAACLIAPPAVAAGSGTPRVLAIHFTSEVDPVTKGWLDNQLDRARRDHYAAAVIVLDTPGGDEESMRGIVQKELSLSASGEPVLVYVSPGGARAASAGVWISEAADILAMAPNTNIGSSTPISGTGANLGSDLRRKVINDAAASLRGLAGSHGRNAAWADKAVRVASNLTDTEALRMNVVDLISPSLPALLNTIDGRKTVPAGLVLHTKGATIVNVEQGFVTRFLSTLLNPNVVSLLFLAGIVGIGFEIFHPGIVLPGAFGAVSMLLALFGLYVLPLSWTGLALVLLGVALLVVDAHVVTHGALTVAGLVSLGFGLASLFQSSSGPHHTSIPLIISITVVLGGGWALAMAKAIAIRRTPAIVGPNDIVGMRGTVREGGMVYIHGELWRVRSNEPLAAGQSVVVDGLDGLTLRVHPV